MRSRRNGARYNADERCFLVVGIGEQNTRRTSFFYVPFRAGITPNGEH